MRFDPKHDGSEFGVVRSVTGGHANAKAALQLLLRVVHFHLRSLGLQIVEFLHKEHTFSTVWYFYRTDFTAFIVSQHAGLFASNGDQNAYNCYTTTKGNNIL